MANDFTALRKSRQSRLDALQQEVQKLQGNNNQGGSDDDRFWKPEVDKAGNGYAVIRFLPAPSGEDVEFIRIWDHGFQGPGGWYIEKSLTTLGQDDPVSEYNKQLWDSGIEANKDIVRKQKRRLAYISNIYVVSDKAHPENEGKVFLYKYGKKIYEKINAALNPEFEDEKSMNPFDLWEGANFKLKIRNVEGYRNYDKSEFESPSALSEDDSAIEEIWGKQYSLLQFLDEKNFKSYDELKKKFDMVMGLAGGTISTKKAEDTYLDEEFESAPKVQATAAPKQVEKAPKKEVDFDDDDESLSYFAKLAED